MPTLLSDPTRTMYIVFGAMVVILGAMALRRQKKSDVITFVVAALLFLVLFLIDRAYESPREKVVRTLQEMESASQARKYDDVFKHISNDFKYKSLDKKTLRERAAVAEGQFPEGVRIWNLTRESYKAMVDGTIEQEFDVQPVNNPQFRYQCVAVFKQEADGEWRMITFRLYPVVGGAGDGKREEVTPPGL
jgi:hypothetical protein